MGRHVLSRIVRSWALVCVLFGLAQALPVQAQTQGECFCKVSIDQSKIGQDEPVSVIDDRDRFDRICYPNITKEKCVQNGDPAIEKKFDNCAWVEPQSACAARVTEYDADRENIKQLIIARRNGGLTSGGAVTGPGTIKQPGLLAKVLPECVFDSTVHGECKDVNVFIKLAIDMADILLSIIGGIALIAFLYGGFVLILSEGNSEKIEKGKGAMVAALIGLAVVFGAYLMVNILSDALGVSSTFRLQ